VEQNVAGNEGVKSLDNTPSLFTIADLSRVWVLCDVFENDLGQVRVGDAAEIRLNAFPDHVFQGRISDLSRVLDPNTRSAKARIELDNAGGLLRPGMFATVRFRSVKTAPQLLVPAAAVLRLQDKDWVFRQQDDKHFRKQEVRTAAAQEGMLRVTEGLASGDAIAASALEFSAAVTEKQP
jgi:cobalt-zinc-cadmium efflux system membrane fusion protein